MKIYENLYTDDEVLNKEEIIQLISDGKIVYNLFLICIDKNSKNLFEILECKEFFKPIHFNKNYLLIGICYGKQNAFNIIKDIFLEQVSKKSDLNKIKSKFFRNI